ncbi:MAG: TrmB family transcriptional regulator [Anaerolineales bacterium]|nr:MAG: TrmB family transcriptional regulator [Anaerolineales bacterium]
MDLVAELNGIGFTDSEAKVYLVLLRNNPATGYQLSKVSGVPRSMVYEALGRLDARGAVLKSVEAKATLYRPLPPEALLESADMAHQRKMQALSSGLSHVYETGSGDFLWTITGENSVISYAADMIQSAQDELMLVLSDQGLRELQEFVRVAHDRGVRVSALLTGDLELGCGKVAYHPPHESELQELTDNIVVVVDEQEALIANSDEEMSATVTTNRNLVLITRQFIWMELFAQRIYSCLDKDLIAKLNPEDQKLFNGFTPVRGKQVD